MTTSALPDEGDRARLTRATVIDRALALADKSGLDALTIRKLATGLGVTPMALYWHFRGKDELLEGLAERIWSEIDLTVDRTLLWTEQIRGLFEALLKVLRAHPAAPELLLHSETLGIEAKLNATELTLDILRRAGFSPADASYAASSALWTGIMLVMSEPGIELLDDAERAEMQRKKQVILATQSPVKFPRVVECALPMTACDNPEDHYKFGVDLFIGGLAAIAAARGGAPEPPSDLLQSRISAWGLLARGDRRQLTARTLVRCPCGRPQRVGQTAKWSSELPHDWIFMPVHLPVRLTDHEHCNDAFVQHLPHHPAQAP